MPELALLTFWFKKLALHKTDENQIHIKRIMNQLT